MFSGPNDPVIKSNSAICFTDSISGLRSAGAVLRKSCLSVGSYLVKDGKGHAHLMKLRDPQAAGALLNGICAFSVEKSARRDSVAGRSLRYDVRGRRHGRQPQRRQDSRT